MIRMLTALNAPTVTTPWIVGGLAARQIWMTVHQWIKIPDHHDSLRSSWTTPVDLHWLLINNDRPTMSNGNLRRRQHQPDAWGHSMSVTIKLGDGSICVSGLSSPDDYHWELMKLSTLSARELRDAGYTFTTAKTSLTRIKLVYVHDDSINDNDVIPSITASKGSECMSAFSLAHQELKLYRCHPPVVVT